MFVDRNSSSAHQIIHIQEDLGMNFNGSDDEKVKQAMDLEDRD
jgi:hypothetical protein